LSESISDEEELLEIDYADLGRFINEIEAAAASSKKMLLPPPRPLPLVLPQVSRRMKTGQS